MDKWEPPPEWPDGRGESEQLCSVPDKKFCFEKIWGGIRWQWLKFVLWEDVRNFMFWKRKCYSSVWKPKCRVQTKHVLFPKSVFLNFFVVDQGPLSVQCSDHKRSWLWESKITCEWNIIGHVDYSGSFTYCRVKLFAMCCTYSSGKN